MHNSHYKLLVVDDEVGIRQSLVTYLEDSGFVVYEAADAITGFEVFKEHAPDLVITDLCMPKVNGLTLLQQIHELVPSVPVIVISGAGVMSDVVQALRLGAMDYLIKPIVDMEVLVHTVENSLERSQLLVDNQRYRVQLEEVNTQLKQHIAILEQDQKAGHCVQQSMLPVSPFYARDYISEYRLVPSLYLSGDCVDYAFIKQRYFAFYLADVSGHGSAPAFVAIWLKGLVAQLVRLKQMLVQFDSEAGALLELLEMVNDELIEMGINNHLTLVVGFLDTEIHQLYYIVAGHLPLPVLYYQGNAQFLEGSGKPIGLYEQADWEVYQTEVPDNTFSLLLFSDGVLELLEPQALEEKEHALLQLIEHTEGNIDCLMNQLGIADIEELPDDIAVLSIKKMC
ncbi:fused response regulator/phosphatase [Candidatus Endobugula sertula]|uniref:Fused response regulator/phosphatase n=1 Tax=Candidatus Endobugula sertula TaxID=62101 RepID=A0A1D2QS45_9GAMM|nr:fused response regulator/phosphatase [Candidatus Endobugula sertula]